MMVSTKDRFLINARSQENGCACRERLEIRLYRFAYMYMLKNCVALDTD